MSRNNRKKGKIYILDKKKDNAPKSDPLKLRPLSSHFDRKILFIAGIPRTGGSKNDNV